MNIQRPGMDAILKLAALNEAPAQGNGRAPAGYDVEAINREFALALVGSKAVIIHESQSASPEHRVRFLSLDAFKAWMANRLMPIQSGDRVKMVPYSRLWLEDPARRQYRGIEFFPDPKNGGGTAGFFNLWRGFEVQPVAKPGAYPKFFEHLWINLCRESEDLYDWVFGWFAHIMQRPRERVGTAIAIRGDKGSGKTKIGQVFGSLVASNYLLVDDPRYVVGNFNAHMASCLLLQADEGFWAGNHAAEGRLKGLITAETQMIEQKGIDPIQVRNYLRLLITGNADWTVPASMDERRYCVIDINPVRRMDIEFFAAIDDEMNKGGREALLHDLLAFDLSRVNLRSPPLTEALLKQKIHSFEGIDKWWFERLMAGAPTRWRDTWPSIVAKEEMFADYVRHAEMIGLRRRSSETEVGMRLHKLVVGLGTRKTTVENLAAETNRLKRWPCYVLPSLDACREAFSAALGQQVAWPSEEEESNAPPA